LRAISGIIREGLQRQGFPPDVTVRELVFDYDIRELRTIVAAVEQGERHPPIPPRQFFCVIDPPAEYPPLAQPMQITYPPYRNAALKDPDEVHPFGLAVGLLVGSGTRFVRAMAFCRSRRGREVKGYGRMLALRFRAPRVPQPFALGDHCHFGLGLFLPAPDDAVPRA
jgi:hypothetical protein